ncbi:MAG: FAD-dependent oxidoreductase [Verrucomicrobiales bacterium]|nr:FAD-dependent oxidoreductase [Verrucomicrobiales bacterium]
MKSYDVAILGGGVAGLWTANALKARGYSVVLFSKTDLGAGQTLAAQGVIHGGAKYALAGKLTDSSEQLAAMPGRWRDALNGKGDIDLSGVEVLSPSQTLWSLPSVTSQVVSFFGSKLMRGRADALPRESWPEALQSDRYHGRVFKIDEPVIDPVSLVASLSASLSGICYQADCEIKGSGGRIESITADGIEIEAETYVFAAGAGNADLMKAAGVENPAMQLRPLHQLVARGDLPDFYSVCIGNGPKPPMVTTTHTDSSGRKIWWIGGDIAEANGVARSESEQIEAGRGLLQKFLPWIRWDEMEIFTARANRAEPLTESGERPPGAFCQKVGNILVTWPTKLALAPDLSDQVIGHLGAPQSPGGNATPLDLPSPGIGKPPWDR